MPNINEQELRSYLLGGLTPERHAELKALVQADENLREELFALEEELVEQYLAGCLTAEENQSFKERILNTERGQQKLHFAELFDRYRSSHPADEEPMAVHSVPAPNFPPTRHSSPLFSTFYRNPTFAVLTIAVAGLLIMLVGWTVVGPSRGTSIAEQVSREERVRLVPDSTSGSNINHLTAPAKNVQVKLELELAKSDFKKYKIKLYRENQAIDTRDELQTEARDNTHYFIPVVMTSEILTPGQYQLKLCGVADSGQPSSIDNYSFRVTDADLQDDQRDRFAR